MRGDRLAATAGPADPIGVGFGAWRVGGLLHLSQPDADGRLREPGGDGDGAVASPPSRRLLQPAHDKVQVLRVVLCEQLRPSEQSGTGQFVGGSIQVAEFELALAEA